MVDTTLWIAFSKDAKDTITTTPRLWKSLTEVNTADGPVTPTGTAFQGDGQIARLQDGGYVIVWTDDSGTHNPAGGAIVGQRYDSFGNRVGGEVKISNFVAGFQFLPAITALPNGDVAVAYTDEIEGDQDIFVRIVGTGGASLSPGRIDNIDLGADLTLDPSITAFADGSYVISYRLQNSAADSDIVARIVSPTGTVGAQFDIDNQTDNRGLQELATLSNGNFVAVYRDEHNGDPLDTDIVFQILTPAGTSLTGPLVFPEGLLTPPQDHPDVAALRDGGFVMVWTDSLGPTATDIRAAILSNTAVLVAGASNIMVNTTTAGDQNEASVAALADGGFLVTWEDDTANLVRAQRFDATGQKIGAEFTVKNGTTVDNPGAALLADGRIAYVFGLSLCPSDIRSGQSKKRPARLQWRPPATTGPGLHSG